MNQQEIELLKSMLAVYNTLNAEFDKIEMQLKDLQEKRDSLFSNLEELRVNENNFLAQLSEKYGSDAVSVDNLAKLLT